jgi:hypothetical protein
MSHQLLWLSLTLTSIHNTHAVVVLRDNHIPYGPVIVASVALAFGSLFTIWVILEAFFFSRRSQYKRLRLLDSLPNRKASFVGDLEFFSESEVLVSWHDVCCVYATPNPTGRGDPVVKKALQKASGVLRSGQLTAIMGGR